MVLASATPIALLPMSTAAEHRRPRLAFAYDLAVVPESTVTTAELAQFSQRVLDVCLEIK